MEILIACVDEELRRVVPAAFDTTRRGGVLARYRAGRRRGFQSAAGRLGWGRIGGHGDIGAGVAPESTASRADVAKLLVHPGGRRHGLARRLMSRLEQEAAKAGRPLLTLDTRLGDRADGLYRSMGWVELGRIPDYALTKDGTYDETLFMWKRIERP